MKRNISPTEIISSACSILNKNLLMFLIVTIVMYIVSSIISGMASLSLPANLDPNDIDEIMAMYSGIFFSPWTWISSLVSTLIMAGMIKMCFNAIDGQKVGFEAFGMPVMSYVNFVVTYIVYGIIVGVGCCLCLLPGIFLAVRLFPAIFYTIDRGLSIDDALKEAWNDTAGNFWSIFGSMILFVLFACAGILLCCVGLVYTIPATYIAECLLARVLCGKTE